MGEIRGLVDTKQNAPGEGGAGKAGTIVKDASIVPPRESFVKRDEIPTALLSRKAWVCWRLETRDGRPTKVPYTPVTGRRASSTDPSTWATLDATLDAVDAYSGLGIMFSDGLMGIDLDHCRDKETGELTDWALSIVKEMDTYTEISPSGTGLHILFFGAKPEGKNKRTYGDGGEIEVYDRARYFTFTGEHLPGTPSTVEERQEQLETIYTEYFGPAETEAPTPPPATSLDLTDAELLEKAFNANNGAEIRRLFDEPGTAGNSEGDASLAWLLAFWTGNDPARLERIMRSSSRVRPKWNERRGQTTWIGRECSEAVGRCSNFYDPHPQRGAAATESGGLDLFKPELHFTDTGLSERLVLMYGQDLQHVWDYDQWLCWNEKHWDENPALVHARAGQLPKLMLRQAVEIKDDDFRAKAVKFSLKAESERSRNAAVSLARSLPGIPVKPDELDSHPYLLPCLNCVLDLDTGEKRSHRREDLITKLCPVDFDASAQSPLWDKFLDDCTGGDQELQHYLQQLAGYALTGDTREDILPFIYGPGRTGKSTFLAALYSVLGPYAHTADFSSFTIGAKTAPGSHRDDLAALDGRRLVVASETKKGTGFDVGLVKLLTGGDIINARPAYGKTKNFKPKFKLFLAANDRPTVDDLDDAFWRRLREIPFSHVVPEDQVNTTLKQKLCDTETTGRAILAWAVRGCHSWMQDGLITPKCVTQATEEYRREQDPLAAFIEDACVIEPEAQTPVAGLYEAYLTSCVFNGIKKPMTRAVFGKRLESAGYPQERIRIEGVQVRIRRGIGLKTIS